MRTGIALAVGAIAGYAWLRESRRRQAAERLAAATLESLLNAIEATDADTGAHVRRVARYSLALANAIGMTAADRRELVRVALFHDIGKIHEALFDIVHDKAALSAKDRRAIATHPRRGAQVLAPLSPFFPQLAHSVIAHHERWDGTGYPRKLRGARIPLAARIVAIADTFDVIAHGRRYRPGTGAITAAKIIGEGRGTQFDPALVDLLLLPPVLADFVRIHRAAYRQPAERRPRDPSLPRGRRHRVPEIAFRWRTRTAEPPVVSAARRRRG